MSSQQAAVAGAVVAALKADPGIAGGRVYRNKTRPIATGQSDGVVVRLVRSASTEAEMMGGRTTWKTLVSIECYGKGTPDVPDAGADPIVEAVFARLATVPNLGGLAQDVAPFEGGTLEWDYDEQDTTLCAITAHFVVSHQTTERLLT